MTTKIDGELEIDSDRGVIYFHTHDEKFMDRFGGITILRVGNLPTPIPLDTMIDVLLPSKPLVALEDVGR